ncbi:MAG: NAD(P)H-hydrate dehydratase [Ignavibacteria bacterium]
MKNVYFNRDILVAEKEIIGRTGISPTVLMENAGRNASEIIAEFYCMENCTGVLILCGRGNNAGDGFVIARHLRNKQIPVMVYMLNSPEELRGDALKNYEIIAGMKDRNLEISGDPSLLGRPETGKFIIVDAVYGIGFRDKLDAKAEETFGKINRLKNKFIIAVDIVSGLDNYLNSNKCLKADVTVSMGVKKFETMFYDGRRLSGEIRVADIGLPEALFEEYNEKRIFEIEKRDASEGFKARDINSNKYTNGKLYVLAGSEGFSGAAYLCAQSAIRAGCGAVILGLPKGLNQIMELKTSEVITQPLEKENYLNNESLDRIRPKIEWCNTMLIGPGIGRNSDTLSLARNLVKSSDKNIVIDADGIFAFKGYTDFLKKKERRIILTPHFGEFANLLGITTDELKKNFFSLSKKFASENNIVLVLKNSPTVITDGETFFINSSGRENLATIGSGDVLSGIIASLYSQNGDALSSAISGAYLHGLCGDTLYDEYGSSGTIASDLIDLIPKIKSELE